VAFGAAADHRFAHLIHLDRALHAGVDANLFERVLHRQRVHHRRQHPHVIGLRAVHARCCPRHPAKDIAAANHQADFKPGVLGRLHFLGEFGDEGRINSELLPAHEHLARKLEQHALDRRK